MSTIAHAPRVIRSVAFRRDYGDICNDGKRFRKAGKTWRKIPVVVAEQYAHSNSTPGDFWLIGGKY